MSQFSKVRIIRLKERQGLIRARLAGAAVAKGQHDLGALFDKRLPVATYIINHSFKLEVYLV